MRVLIVGATGYIGSRVVGALLQRGDEVVAAARSPLALDALWWSDRVDRAAMDMADAESVAAAVRPGLDAIVYLVHGMGGIDFAETDAAAARAMRDAVDRAGAPRVVYVSGIIPPIDEADLSEHLRSRLQVERLLSESSASVITLRAAMVLGSGSTSFELMSQLSSRLPITVIPHWMENDVEPIAVVDLVRAVLGALDVDQPTRHYDVGGGEALSYPDLIARVAELRGEERPSLSVPLLPEGLVAKIATWIADVPAPTVTALMESLREPMVAADRAWRADLLPAGAADPLTLEAAVERAVTAVDPLSRPSQRDPMGALPGDPDWADTVG